MLLQAFHISPRGLEFLGLDLLVTVRNASSDCYQYTNQPAVVQHLQQFYSRIYELRISKTITEMIQASDRIYPTLRSRFQMTPRWCFRKAVKHGKFEVVQDLMKSTAYNPYQYELVVENNYYEYHKHLIYQAAQRGYYQIVDLLLDNAPNPGDSSKLLRVSVSGLLSGEQLFQYKHQLLEEIDIVMSCRISMIRETATMFTHKSDLIIAALQLGQIDMLKTFISKNDLGDIQNALDESEDNQLMTKRTTVSCLEYLFGILKGSGVNVQPYLLTLLTAAINCNHLEIFIYLEDLLKILPDERGIPNAKSLAIYKRLVFYGDRFLYHFELVDLEMFQHAVKNNLIIEWLKTLDTDDCGFYSLKRISTEVFDAIFSYLVTQGISFDPFIQTFLEWALYLPVRCIKVLHVHCGDNAKIVCSECVGFIKENIKGQCMPYQATAGYYLKNILIEY